MLKTCSNRCDLNQTTACYQEMVNLIEQIDSNKTGWLLGLQVTLKNRGLLEKYDYVKKLFIPQMKLG